jgi:hypothetical protein
MTESGRKKRTLDDFFSPTDENQVKSERVSLKKWARWLGLSLLLLILLVGCGLASWRFIIAANGTLVGDSLIVTVTDIVGNASESAEDILVE